MRFLRVAAATLAAAVVADARLYRIGIPETIKPGDVFNASVEQLSGIPLQYTMLWGIERYDDEWSVFPRPGSLGPVMLSVIDLQKTVGDGSVSNNTTIGGLSVPADYPYYGRAAIQAVIFEIAGPLNSPIIETWWWSVNITNTTSETLVWASYADDNARICQIPFQ
ncbi:hypothetical protein F4677DRAFT_441753 [Hypoxylon crocopeplum]|nr:hypothetical protein F4677DRAFT_441753 [Hypoxylon crocopeplum]